MTALRQSPLHDRLLTLQPEWGVHNDMPVVLRVTASDRSIELCDVSTLHRMGLKGPCAAEWLALNGVSVPSRANSWRPLDGNGLAARLGRTEFLIEDGWHGSTAPALRTKLGAGIAGVYPVFRQDAALLVRGPCVHELFAQTCNVDFKSIPWQERTVMMTMMVGVSVTVVNPSIDSNDHYRIWCDGTYGAYLWDTLLAIAVELGGGVADVHSVYQEASGTPAVDA